MGVPVLYPTDGAIIGFIELYDEDIAIVTSALLPQPDIRPVNLYHEQTFLPPGTNVTAVGRGFMKEGFMLQNGALIDEGPISADDPKS